MTELPQDFGNRDVSTLAAVVPGAAFVADIFSPADVFARIASRIPAVLPPEALDRTALPAHGDHHLNDWIVDPQSLASSRSAAVLAGLIERNGALYVLLTQRASALRVHSGQIAFPGGKIDETDASPAAAAIREAQEEIGIPPEKLTFLGYLPPYLSGSGFRIVPVLAKITAPFDVVLNPDEVTEIFEVPFAFCMNAANHELRQREWNGGLRKFYAIPYGDRHIWGITAGIIRVLYERLYA